MRLSITAIGRLKQGPERDLAAHYAKRAGDAGRRIGFGPIDIVEIRESRSQDTARRIAEESIAIASAIPDGAVTVLLDPRGENLASDQLAARLRRWQSDGRGTAAFVIGGPDGLADNLREQAALRLAFGAATWPHQIVRIMLLEQLYRAMTILSGHPYHRA